MNTSGLHTMRDMLEMKFAKRQYVDQGELEQKTYDKLIPFIEDPEAELTQ